MKAEIQLLCLSLIIFQILFEIKFMSKINYRSYLSSGRVYRIKGGKDILYFYFARNQSTSRAPCVNDILLFLMISLVEK